MTKSQKKILRAISSAYMLVIAAEKACGETVMHLEDLFAAAAPEEAKAAQIRNIDAFKHLNVGE